MASLGQKIRTAITDPAHIYGFIYHRMRTSFSYIFSDLLNDKAALPETVNIYPTSRCNLDCSICFARFLNKQKELDLKQWMIVIDKLKYFSPRIHLSGGEPFMHSEITKLIHYIKERGFFLHITTNGTLIEEFADDIVKLQVNRLDISVDGPEKLHDEMRRVKGTFNKISRGLMALNQKRNGRPRPIIKINSIINLREPEAMRDLLQQVEEWQADSIQFIYPLYLKTDEVAAHRKFISDKLHIDINYWRHAANWQPEPADYERVWSYVQQLNQKKNAMKIDIFPRFTRNQCVAFYQKDVNFYDQFSGTCRAMWNTATILPDGDMESCPDYIIGNLLSEDLNRIWNSDSMLHLRRRIKDGSFFSVCRACCFFYQ